ncbi:MAG TPA: hypothetical protein VG816_15105 [Solirubrobacterales bacterium]|nr:hypothetical protein [Solirubrobacterales bacterium]
MSRKATDKRCVFCGRTDQKMSKEHLWPEWVRKLLPDALANQKVVYSMADSHLGEIRKIELRLFDLTVKDVCEPCNTGWMHRIEDAMKSVTEHLLRGGQRELHAGGQTTIAAWAVLKLLVMSRVMPRRLVLDADYEAIFETGQELEPPSCVRVYTAGAAWSKGQAPSGFFRVNGIEEDLETADEDQIDGYLGTISVLDLVVQVFRVYGDDSASEDFVHSPGLAPSVRRIWPVTPSFVWPPGSLLTTNGIKALAGGEFAA